MSFGDRGSHNSRTHGHRGRQFQKERKVRLWTEGAGLLEERTRSESTRKKEVKMKEQPASPSLGRAAHHQSQD